MMTKKTVVTMRMMRREVMLTDEILRNIALWSTICLGDLLRIAIRQNQCLYFEKVPTQDTTSVQVGRGLSEICLNTVLYGGKLHKFSSL